MTNTMRRDDPPMNIGELNNLAARPDLLTKRLKMYLKLIEDTDDEDPAANHLWFAMSEIHMVGFATCHGSGYVRYISVCDGFRRQGYGLEMCLALDNYYRGNLLLEHTVMGGGHELAAAFERTRRWPWTPASAVPKTGLPGSKTARDAAGSGAEGQYL